jgi:hypothetical protein
MGEIRNFDESFIPDVATLDLKVFHSSVGNVVPELEQYLAKIFLENPWRDASVQSLVYLEHGRVVGFLGVIPRQMKFYGRDVLVGITSQLMVDREAHRGMAGAQLLKQFLNGPQELSLADGANESAHALWTALGAKVARLYSLDWLKVLQPLRFFRYRMRQSRKLFLNASASVLYPACWLGDVAISQLSLGNATSDRGEDVARPVGPEELLECIRRIGWQEALQPSYDPESFRWLIEECGMARHRGLLHNVVVGDRNRNPIGWYVCHYQPHGVSTVLQIGAAPRKVRRVLRTLWSESLRHDAIAVRGQAMPRHLFEFKQEGCALEYPGNGVVVHSRNPELLACVLQGDAALTRLDGEWWMRFADTDWVT